MIQEKSSSSSSPPPKRPPSLSSSPHNYHYHHYHHQHHHPHLLSTLFDEDGYSFSCGVSASRGGHVPGLMLVGINQRSKNGKDRNTKVGPTLMLKSLLLQYEAFSGMQGGPQPPFPSCLKIVQHRFQVPLDAIFIAEPLMIQPSLSTQRTLISPRCLRRMIEPNCRRTPTTAFPGLNST